MYVEYTIYPFHWLTGKRSFHLHTTYTHTGTKFGTDMFIMLTTAKEAQNYREIEIDEEEKSRIDIRNRVETDKKKFTEQKPMQSWT